MTAERLVHSRLRASELRPAHASLLLTDLLRVLALERIDIDLFRGESRDIGTPQVFGGQVLGQALMAALATVEGRVAHSLHAYFLSRGDIDLPIVYQVERGRDGRSFSNRRVTATQRGEQIFNVTISFQKAEEKADTDQSSMPDVPPPESLDDVRIITAHPLPALPEELRAVLSREKPFEFRFVQAPFFDEEPTNSASVAVQQVWFRAVSRISDDPHLHQALLAYASDYYLLSAAMRQPIHGNRDKKFSMASIDHAIWFHRAARVDDWLLYSIESPTMAGSRGFARASIYSRHGQLIASTAQEGLIRFS